MMKRLLLGSALLCAAIGSTWAADMPVKAPVQVVTQTPYTGLYFGVLGAGAKTPTDVEFLNIPGSGNIKPSGLMAGGLVGAGTWRGAMFVGLEADGSFDFSKAKQPCAVLTDCTIKSGWLLTQRVVIGAQLADLTGAARRIAPASGTQWRDQLALPSTLSGSTIMPYLTAGIAERRTEACVSDACSHQWLIGPTGGGGLRIPIASGVSVGAEYLYVRYDKHFSPAGGPPIFAADFKAISEHIGRVSLTGHY
jgi:opacity protein-like surface antigen